MMSDCCGTSLQEWVTVQTAAGPLILCQHHARQHAAALRLLPVMLHTATGETEPVFSLT